MDAEVLGDLALRLGPLQPLDRLVDEVGVIRVDPASGVAQPAVEVDLLERGALGRLRRLPRGQGRMPWRSRAGAGSRGRRPRRSPR